MGFIKDQKADLLLRDAQRAMSEGRTVFAPRLLGAGSQVDMSGSMSGWAEMIEAIESAGWVMYHWSVTNGAKGRPEAFPLFRRPTPPGYQ